LIRIKYVLIRIEKLKNLNKSAEKKTRQFMLGQQLTIVSFFLKKHFEKDLCVI